MPGIDIKQFEAKMPAVREASHAASALRDNDKLPARAFKELHAYFMAMAEGCLFELKEQLKTIESRDREIADLKRRLREAGAFVP